MTLEQMKTWIDQAGYEQLLAKWRFAPMAEKKASMGMTPRCPPVSRSGESDDSAD